MLSEQERQGRTSLSIEREEYRLESVIVLVLEEFSD